MCLEPAFSLSPFKPAACTEGDPFVMGVEGHLQDGFRHVGDVSHFSGARFGPIALEMGARPVSPTPDHHRQRQRSPACPPTPMLEAEHHMPNGETVLLAPFEHDGGSAADPQSRSYPIIPDFSSVPVVPGSHGRGPVIAPTPTKPLMGPPRTPGAASPRHGKRRSEFSPLKIDFTSNPFLSPPHSRHPMMSLHLSSAETLASFMDSPGQSSEDGEAENHRHGTFSPSQAGASSRQMSPGKPGGATRGLDSPRTPLQFKAALARLERAGGRRLGLCI